MKIFIKGLKKDIALGDLVQKSIRATIDPQGRYDKCPVCKERQRRLNSLLTLTGTAPVQHPSAQTPVVWPQQESRRPSDWQQMYPVDDESIPDGGR